MKVARFRLQHRFVAITLAWSLALLVVTNAFWSWRFSQEFPASYQDQWMEFLITYPSEPFGSLAADGEHEVTYTIAGRTHREYSWLSRFDTVTGPVRSSPESRARFGALFSPKPDGAPGWVKPERLRDAGELGDGGIEVEMFTATGWPVRLLWCRWKRGVAGDEVDSHTAIVLREPSAASLNSVASVLPFRPIWTGQLIIGSFWCGAVLSVQTLWWASRRGWCDRRARRGHCPHCNYNLRANTTGICPECGTTLPTRASQ